MKKTKAFILIAVSAVLLVGCSRNGDAIQNGKLPAGGEKTDLATSEGQEVMKNRLEAVSKAYEELNLDSVAITSEVSGFNVAFNANLEQEKGGKFSLEAGIKDFGAKAEMKAAKDGKNVKASFSNKTTGGNFSLKGSLPEKEGEKNANVDASLSLSGIEANAYLSENKAYIDMSNKGIETFVKNTETFVNKTMGQIKETALAGNITYLIQSYELDEIYDFEKGRFDLVSAYNKNLPDKKIAIKGKEPVEWPTISADEVAEETSISLDDIGTYVKSLAEMDIDLEFITYKNDSFGFSVSLDKESMKALAKAADNEEYETWYSVLPNMFTNLTCNVSALFNKDNLLESIGFAYECDAKIDNSLMKSMGYSESMFKSLDVNYSLKAKESISIKYGNIDVQLPDFSDYKEVEIDYDELKERSN